MPNIPSGGTRQQKAEALRAEMEAKAAAPQQQAGAQFHQVQEGETLESIAAQYGQTADAIWQHPLNKQLKNRLGTPAGLGRGDGIYIPEAEEQQSGGPVGQGDHIVQKGECISSIAKTTGHFWETIWNEPDNSELKEVRKDPNVLLPGDRVTIPALRQKEEPGETEKRHRFVRRGEPAIFRMRLLRAPRRRRQGDDTPNEPQPRKDVPFDIYFDGVLALSGVTDAEGKIECPIPGNTREGKLVVEPGTPKEKTYPIRLGHLPPITEIQGVKARLCNLAFPCGAGGDTITEALRRALRAFQGRYGLDSTGEPDEATRDKLVEVHGS